MQQIPIIRVVSEALVSEREAAARLGLSVKTLRRWRWLRQGPPWVKVGAAVRYAPGDISAFIETNRQTATAGGGKAG
jgi:predicted DNA-binding transcriptional regulator AlpA